MSQIVEPGPGFLLTPDGSTWSYDASLDLERVEFGDSTVASLIVRLKNLEPGLVAPISTLEGVGIELTHNDLLYLARDLNKLYEDITFEKAGR